MSFAIIRSAAIFGSCGSLYAEARAASSINHRNAIAVYDFGATSDGLLYIVMEHLRRRTLTSVNCDDLVEVIDCGLARFPDSIVTERGISGALEYMAPEQIVRPERGASIGLSRSDASPPRLLDQCADREGPELPMSGRGRHPQGGLRYGMSGK